MGKFRSRSGWYVLHTTRIATIINVIVLPVEPAVSNVRNDQRYWVSC